jgi:translation initiation factor IF-2
VEVSGLTGKGLDDLVETISATAEIMEIRGESEGKAHGFVIESKLQKGLGYYLPSATFQVGSS